MSEAHRWNCYPSFVGFLRNDRSGTARYGCSKELLKDGVRIGERVLSLAVSLEFLYPASNPIEEGNLGR